MLNFVVTTHHENGTAIGKPSSFERLSTVQGFINLMWHRKWADHFTVTGPDWKVIVRRNKKFKPVAKAPQQPQDEMPF